MLAGVPDRRAREHEPGVGAVVLEHALQPPDDPGDVHPVDAGVGVRFVDHHEVAGREESRPAIVVVEVRVHAREVRDDHVRLLADSPTVLAVLGVAVVDSNGDLEAQLVEEVVQTALLIAGEGLRRVQQIGGRLHAAGPRLEHVACDLQRVDPGLPRGGAGRDADVLVAGERLEGGGLMGVEVVRERPREFGPEYVLGRNRRGVSAGEFEDGDVLGVCEAGSGKRRHEFVAGDRYVGAVVAIVGSDGALVAHSLEITQSGLFRSPLVRAGGGLAVGRPARAAAAVAALSFASIR